jgi:DNA-binding PadR family transcriptional regulator
MMSQHIASIYRTDTLIDLAILGLLKEHELHGYELKKRLAEVLGPVSSVSFGSLYPALARLEREGHVKVVEANDQPAPPVPMTGGLTGELAALRAAASRTTRDRRGKKVYGITDAGSARLTELLEGDRAAADDDRSFRLRIAFSRHLPAPRRLGVFERRRARLLERLEEVRRHLDAAGGATDPYTRSLMEHETASTEHDIAWLDRLIASEQAGGNPR